MKLRRAFTCLVAGLLVTAFSVPIGGDAVVYAASVSTNAGADGVSVVQRAEETEWVYRVVDGKLQKRLWSITYEKWLTDWEWVW